MKYKFWGKNNSTRSQLANRKLMLVLENHWLVDMIR